MNMVRCLAAIAGFALALAAQKHPRGDTRTPPEWQPEGVLRVPAYVAEFSWPLFTACDLDADDRLDLIEARTCVIMLDADDARVAFRRLDQNRDGFLYWPEFDELYRRATSDGDGLYLRPGRIAALDDLAGLESRRDNQTPSANEVMASFDSNRDKNLNADEISSLLDHYGLDSRMAEKMQAFDSDGSGSIDLDELTTILQFVRLPTSKTIKLPPEAGAPPRFEFDRNRDGFVELSELESALLVMAPTLVPWAKTIIKQADRDGDQRLSILEILDASGR